MNDEDTLPPEPDTFDLCNGFSKELPVGEWHMWRFTCAYKSGKSAPETMEFLATAFDRILHDLQESHGTGEQNRAKILNKHLPITTGKPGRSTRLGRRRGKNERTKQSMAFKVERLMRTEKISQNKAREKVEVSTGASKSTVERAYKAYGASARELYDFAENKDGIRDRYEK